MPRWALWLQVLLTVVGLAVWFYLQTSAFLANPPSGFEYYALNWGFQLMAFAIVRLPIALLLLGVALVIEYGAVAVWNKLKTSKS